MQEMILIQGVMRQAGHPSPEVFTKEVEALLRSKKAMSMAQAIDIVIYDESKRKNVASGFQVRRIHACRTPKELLQVMELKVTPWMLANGLFITSAIKNA